MQGLRETEVFAQLLVADFLDELPEDAAREDVSIVIEPALLGDGLDRRGGCAPAFFGGLGQVAFGEVGSGLAQVLGAELAVVVGLRGGHGASLVAPAVPRGVVGGGTWSEPGV